MSEERFSSDIFSFDRKSAAAYATSEIAPYLPYADAWKKFDKLQQEVKGRGTFRLVRSAGDIVLYSIGAFSLHHFSKHNMILILIVWAAAVALDLVVATSAKRRFAHWPCPRCHSEWPGNKTDKDRACKVCGLRLHQPYP